MFGFPVTLMAATDRTLWPFAPLLEKNGPVLPSFPAEIVTTTPFSAILLATKAQGSSANPSGLPMLAVMMSAYRVVSYRMDARHVLIALPRHRMRHKMLE